VPVTVLKVDQLQVVAVRSEEKDKYTAVQLGYGKAKVKNVSQPNKGHFAKAGTAPKKKLQEIRVAADSALKQGDEVKANIFTAGERVDICGVSKGKGFQGVVRRFRVAGGPASHGSMFHRRIGSIGMRQTPGRSWKNQAMPGHMGQERRTVQNLRVVKVIAEKNLILVKGAIPGANGDDVIVRSAIKGQRKAAK